MARDEALARCLEPDSAVLRLYAWSRPTVSFGRNEPALDVYGGARSSAFDFVRRPTGGRAVLHDAEVTYAVVAQMGALGGPRDAYRRINEALAAALRSLGAGVEVVEGSEGTGGGSLAGEAGSEGPAILPLDAGPCFRSPAPGEVTAGGRKLVGSAQARVGRALLQHGSIILDGDQSALADLAGGKAEHDAPASLRSLLGAVEAVEVEDAVARAVLELLGGRAERGVYSQQEETGARELETARYGTEAWTWRR